MSDNKEKDAKNNETEDKLKDNLFNRYDWITSVWLKPLDEEDVEFRIDQLESKVDTIRKLKNLKKDFLCKNRKSIS